MLAPNTITPHLHQFMSLQLRKKGVKAMADFDKGWIWSWYLLCWQSVIGGWQTNTLGIDYKTGAQFDIVDISNIVVLQDFTEL